MSKNDDSHCAGTTKVAVMSQGKERLKRKVFRHPRKTDMMRQTVPSTGSGNRKRWIADSNMHECGVQDYAIESYCRLYPIAYVCRVI